MKRTVIAVLTLSLLASSLALADPPPWKGHGRGEGDHHEWRREDHGRGDYRHWRREDDHGDHRRWERFDADRYHRPSGYYYRSWERGDRLPIAYRAPEYIVPDPGMYHLAPPPPGYCWVRVDNRAVLAAIATGIVLNVVSHAFR